MHRIILFLPDAHHASAHPPPRPQYHAGDLGRLLRRRPGRHDRGARWQIRPAVPGGSGRATSIQVAIHQNTQKVPPRPSTRRAAPSRSRGVSFTPSVTEADFDAYRRNRAFHAWRQAMGAAGLKLPFLTSGAAATWAFARAQQSAKLPRIGVLWHAGNAEQEATKYKALLMAYIDGITPCVKTHAFTPPRPEPDIGSHRLDLPLGRKIEVLRGLANASTARVHRDSWRCGNGLAACGTSAAASNAGSRLSQQFVTARVSLRHARVPPGPQ